MNIKKWFKRLFARRQKSITMFNGLVLYKRSVPEILSIGVSYGHQGEFHFTIFMTNKEGHALRCENEGLLESERARLIEWVNSWL